MNKKIWLLILVVFVMSACSHYVKDFKPQPIDQAYLPKVQIADDVAAGEVKYFNISLYLKTTADNTYMDAINKDVANLIAVQYNGPAPQADLTSAGIQWPNGDTNY